MKFLDSGKTMVRLRVACKTRKKDGDRWTDGDEARSSTWSCGLRSPTISSKWGSRRARRWCSFTLRSAKRQYEKDGEKRSSLNQHR